MKSERIFLILAVCWMIFIFYMSSRNAEESSRDSLVAGTLICEMLVPGFRELPEEQKLEKVESIHGYIRKGAHMTEYAVLGLLVFFYFSRRRRGERILKSWLWAVSYAATDELHQYFVPGRGCSFWDVCIDSAGALAGILIAAAMIKHRSDGVP